MDLKTKFCGITFENPFVLAAAPPTDILSMVSRGLEMGWSGAVLKTTSVVGTDVPLKYPMITGTYLYGREFYALGNIDLISEHHVDKVSENVRKLKKDFPEKIIIASIMGGKKSDWQTLVGILEEAGADIIECSFSCPQGTLGSKPGAMLGQDVPLVKEVTSWIKSAAKRCPVVIKVTPVVSDIIDVVNAVKAGGGDGVAASNTIPSLMGIDLNSLIPIPNVGGKSTYSGLSGPAIKPITLRVIAEIVRQTGIEVTGTGGAMTYKDAVEFMLLGAKNVQFCTAVMKEGFRVIKNLKTGLEEFMEKHDFDTIESFIGKSLQYITTHDKLPPVFKAESIINTKKCVKCGLCYIACKDGGHEAIKFGKNRIPKVDPEKCVGCGLCNVVCPTDCITIKA